MSAASRLSGLFRRNRLAPLLSAGAVVGMLGLAFASVPLYRMFCAATGYEGTPQVVGGAAAIRGERTLRVRFDANVGGGLPWDFEPEQPQIDLRTGQTATVFFKVTNRADHPVTAHAVFNVGPGSTGGLFQQDLLLLLHRPDAGGARDVGDAGGLLPRSRP